MRSTVVIALLATGLTLSACGGDGSAKPSTPAKPKLSAASACRDFASWYEDTHGKVSDASKLAPLLLATSAAPSGQLYQDLSTLDADVLTASKASGSLGQAETEMTISAASTVEQDCQSVNPDS